MKLLYLIGLIFLCGWLSSCGSLKSVGTFNAAAVTSLQQSTVIPTTFTTIYQLRTLTDSLDHHPFNTSQPIGIDFANRIRNDSLRSYQQADSLLSTINALITNYFQSIAALTATGISFKPVQINKSGAVEGFLQSSAIKLSADQTSAVLQVANLLGSGATQTYRRRQVSTLLDRSHNAVRQVLAALAFGYERLAEVIDISREQQYNSYKNGLIQDQTLRYTQRRDLARQWLQTAQTIEQNRQIVLTYVQTLKTVRAGYDVLYEQRDKLGDAALKTSLAAYATTLQQLQSKIAQQNHLNGRFYP